MSRNAQILNSISYSTPNLINAPTHTLTRCRDTVTYRSSGIIYRRRHHHYTTLSITVVSACGKLARACPGFSAGIRKLKQWYDSWPLGGFSCPWLTALAPSSFLPLSLSRVSRGLGSRHLRVPFFSLVRILPLLPWPRRPDCMSPRSHQAQAPVCNEPNAVHGKSALLGAGESRF